MSAAEKAEFLCLAGSYMARRSARWPFTDVAIFKNAYAPLVRAATVVPSPDFRLAEGGESPAVLRGAPPPRSKPISNATANGSPR